MDKNFPIFEASSILHLLWDFTIQLSTFLLILWFTISRSFLIPKEDQITMSIISQNFSILLTIDIFIKTNTKQIRKGSLLTTRRQIFQSFWSRNFLSDIVPWFIKFFVMIYGSRALNSDVDFFLFLKFLKINSFLDRFKEFAVKNERLELIYNLLKLVFLILTMAHLLACVWHLIAITNTSDQHNWLSEKELDNEGWKKSYLICLYWSVTTMLTVGYGDITPVNQREYFFNIWAMFLGCGMFAYSMSRIGEIFKDLGESSRLLK